MNIQARPLNLPDEMSSALELADVSPLGIPHVADWPYRFSSWALDDIHNTRGWFDGPRMLGWAVMQTPFWAIDCVVHPEAPAPLYVDMLTWAKSRASQMHIQGNGRPMWFVSIDAACDIQRRILAAHDFVDVSNDGVDVWSKVLFTLSGETSPMPARLPESTIIRNLNPASEIQAYVDLHREVFESKNMTTAWRTRATQMAGYRNDLDLVVVSAQGELQGFCVAWLRTLSNGQTVGQIEPLGVRPSQRGHRFSQALLAEAVRRLRKLGASRIHVETDRQREAAMAAYASIGFTATHDVLVYRLTIDA